MSWLSSGIKKAGHLIAPVVHRVAQGAGTIGGFIVGGPAGAYAGEKLGDKLGNIGQDALAGKNVRTHLKDNLIGAGEAGAGLYLAGGAPGLGGGSSAASSIDPEGDALYGTETTPGSGSPGILQSALDKAKGVLSGGSGQPGSTNYLQLGLAGLEGANSAYLGGKSNQYANDALKSVTDSYNARAGLRSKAIAGLMNPTAPDTSALSGIAAHNPYAPTPAVPVAPPGGFQVGVQRPGATQGILSQKLKGVVA